MTEVSAVLKDLIVRPAHVGFVVASLEEAVAAASRVYGIDAREVSYQPPAGQDTGTRFAFYTLGGLQFELIEPRSEYFKKILFEMPSGSAGINHMAWEVDDIESALTLLERKGIYPGHVTPDGIVTIGSKKMVYLDPTTTDGLVIELIECLSPNDPEN